MVKEKFIIIEETIKKYKHKNKVGFLCELAGVSRSGYYNYFLPKSVSTRNKQDSKDLESYTNILAAYNFKKRNKGAKQIKMTLQNKFGINYNLKRIRRVVKKYNIV